MSDAGRPPEANFNIANQPADPKGAFEIVVQNDTMTISAPYSPEAVAATQSALEALGLTGTVINADADADEAPITLPLDIFQLAAQEMGFDPSMGTRTHNRIAFARRAYYEDRRSHSRVISHLGSLVVRRGENEQREIVLDTLRAMVGDGSLLDLVNVGPDMFKVCCRAIDIWKRQNPEQADNEQEDA